MAAMTEPSPFEEEFPTFDGEIVGLDFDDPDGTIVRVLVPNAPRLGKMRVHVEVVPSVPPPARKCSNQWSDFNGTHRCSLPAGHTSGCVPGG